jgi:multiple sugar transport system ATP-binding protein
VEASVDVTELMGNEVFIYLTLGSETFVGRVDPRTSFRPGGKVQVALNLEHMHLFEVDGEQPAVR